MDGLNKQIDKIFQFNITVEFRIAGRQLNNCYLVWQDYWFYNFSFAVFLHNRFWLHLIFRMVFYAESWTRGVCSQHGFQCLPLFDHGGHCGFFGLNWIPCRRMVWQPFCFYFIHSFLKNLVKLSLDSFVPH